MKRLLPKTLTGQLIALVLLTLLISQIAGFLFYWEERREAVREIIHDQVVFRTISLVRLLGTENPESHAAILRAASSRNLHFGLIDGPLTREPGDWSARRFERRLARILGPDVSRVHLAFFFHPPEKLRARVRALPHLGARPGLDDDDEDDIEEAEDDHHGYGRRWGAHKRRDNGVFAISLKLTSENVADGPWLVAFGRMPPLPPWNWQSLMAGLLAACILVVVVVFVLRRITKPMARLAGEAEAFGRGGGSQLPEEGPLEARQMIRAFNLMRERIDRFVQDRMQMLAAVSHDLRTPITSLRIRAEFIEDAELREKMLKTLEEMQHMTEETLTFLREEAAKEEVRPVDVTALVGSLVEDLVDLGHEISFEETDAIALPCRPLALKRALTNLMTNALRYGEVAKVHITNGENEISVIIEDDGPGIPEERMARVFEPFVRLEESRSRETGGLGMGLTIARSILRGHGGEVTLENRKEGGLKAIARLPLR